MVQYSKNLLTDEVTRDEGERRLPYKDSMDIWTVAIGRNLQANGLPVDMLAAVITRAGGLTPQEIGELLDHDILEAEDTVDKLCRRSGFKWREISDVRQRVLLNMALNMGYNTFREFKKFWAAVFAGDWMEAGRQMEDSAWWSQVGIRAVRLRRMLEGGV